MESSVCIVGGCGHIGLPLGMALAEVGVPVTLFDIDAARVRRVAA
jgi:UDP-N-acetyl-D-mannosaminuronic acid dehydrogenase